jgi:rare lipoprotein A (peptidoglycan hydrolase)
MLDRQSRNQAIYTAVGALLACVLAAPGSAAEQGLASWYGKAFHGQLAASGETFDAEALTAAHRTLPFGTNVRVMRMDGGTSVVVRINDRGPFSGDRIIDVSEAAARRLGMTHPGVVQVAIEVMERKEPRAPARSEAGEYFVQAGTFRDPGNARRMRIALESVYGAARIVVRPNSPGLMCVVVGEGLTEGEAQQLAGRIRATRKETAGAYVVRLDPTSVQFTD